jgi:DnaJ homolog subfamily A member 5
MFDKILNNSFDSFLIIASRVKKAYKKKALELHPDRNYGNVEASTKLFAEIQSAYEILSDPQERAWYDAHRDRITRNNQNATGDQFCYNTRMTTTDDILGLFSKLHPRMGFTVSGTDFFRVAQEAFDQLAREEALASQWDNLDPVDYPSFGDTDDDFDQVVRPFYLAWGSFSTAKSFIWRNVYRYSEAPDRRVRRLMEKENKKLRDEAIREFNDAVRSLVAFVKKRDPRYKANAQSEAQRQQMLRNTTAAQAARSRAANQAALQRHVTPDWARTEGAEEDSNSNSESVREVFECVPCHKTFKSEGQLEAHERSKKHLKLVKQLCREMKVENDGLERALKGENDKVLHSMSGDSKESESCFTGASTQCQNSGSVHES